MAIKGCSRSTRYFIIDSTIISNYCSGIPEKDIDIKRVKKVAKQAQISNFIENLENQYHTSLGEGIRLSGGQKQRLKQSVV